MVEKPHLKLLVVDDDMVDRMAIIRQMKSSGISAEYWEAETYANGIEAAKSSSYDCILVDYRLPDGTGIDFIELLNRENIPTPIIVLTGQGDETVAVEAMKAGASDYLVKGCFQAEALVQAVLGCIRLHHAQLAAKKAEEKALQSEKMALLGTTIAAISHEINQPLNAIKLLSGSMLYRHRKGEQLTQETMVDTLSKIHASCERVENIIHDVRAFIYREYNSPNIACNINTAITNVVNTLQDTCSASGIMIEQQLSADLPAIRADLQRIEEAISNIVTNAIHALEDMDKSDKLICIETYYDGDVILTIRDNGPGIEESIQEKVFDPFFSTKSSGKGMGLGLPISLLTVQAAGGNIQYRTDADKGASFYISFPVFGEASSEFAQVQHRGDRT